MEVDVTRSISAAWPGPKDAHMLLSACAAVALVLSVVDRQSFPIIGHKCHCNGQPGHAIVVVKNLIAKSANGSTTDSTGMGREREREGEGGREGERERERERKEINSIKRGRWYITNSSTFHR